MFLKYCLARSRYWANSLTNGIWEGTAGTVRSGQKWFAGPVLNMVLGSEFTSGIQTLGCGDITEWKTKRQEVRPGTEPCHECPCPWQISQYLCGSQKDFHSLWRVNWQLIWREANCLYSPKNRIKKNSACGTFQFPNSFFFPIKVFSSLNQCFEKFSKKKKKRK